MNAILQAIKDKVQTYIRDKAKPDPDPAKVGAADTAEIFDDTLGAIDTLLTSLAPLPQGVEWVTPPGEPVFGVGTITESESEISVDGSVSTVPEATLTQPAVGAGMHRIDITVVYYGSLAPPVYEILIGEEVATSETVYAPAIPAGRFAVRQMLVKPGSTILIPPAVVSSASINGGATVYPDLTGKLNLVVKNFAYTISFPSTNREYSDFFKDAGEITDVQLAAGAASFSYSINGAGYVTPTLPLASPIDIPAGANVRYRMTHTAGATLGAIYFEFRYD